MLKKNQNVQVYRKGSEGDVTDQQYTPLCSCKKNPKKAVRGRKSTLGTEMDWFSRKIVKYKKQSMLPFMWKGVENICRYLLFHV